jgi:molecular chaperone HscB
MNLNDNDFLLFGLPERFALDRAEIDSSWRALQASAHPDKFAVEGAAAQRVAMQWSVRINEAHRRLREPLARAGYLCELRGAPIEAHSNTTMPADFLMQQMAWREALDEASDELGIDALNAEVRQEEQRRFDAVAQLLDEAGDAPQAARQVRALMFIARFRAEVSRRLEAIEN